MAGKQFVRVNAQTFRPPIDRRLIASIERGSSTIIDYTAYDVVANLVFSQLLYMLHGALDTSSRTPRRRRCAEHHTDHCCRDLSLCPPHTTPLSLSSILPNVMENEAITITSESTCSSILLACGIDAAVRSTVVKSITAEFQCCLHHCVHMPHHVRRDYCYYY